MDYFQGLTNDDFKIYFLKDLNCLKELTQFIYPNEMLDDNSVIDDHIIRCQNILSDYILNVLTSNVDLSNDQINLLFDEKKKELFSILSPDIETYFQNVKVKYIDLS